MDKRLPEDSIIPSREKGILGPDERPDHRPKMGADSTGPKLPDGKARSSQNAIKHGLSARNLILERGDVPEDPAEFGELLTHTREMYRPNGPLQDSLVERIAICTWRLHRAQRFEVTAITQGLDQHRSDMRREAAEANAQRRQQIEEARAQLGEAQAFLSYLQADPKSDPLDFELTFDVTPAMTAIADLHGRTLPGHLIAENDMGRYQQFLLELGIKDTPAIQQAFIAGLQRVVACETQRVAQREAELMHTPDPEATDSLGALPAPDRLRLIIRYETMLTRDRDKAVAELDRLQGRQE